MAFAEELEELIRKEQFYITIVNSIDKVSSELIKKLKKEGYPVEVFKGPRLSDVRKSEDISRRVISIKPNFIFVEYPDFWESLLIKGSIEEKAKDKKRFIPVLTMQEPDYDLLLENIDIERASRLLSYDWDSFRERIIFSNCDPDYNLRERYGGIDHLLSRLEGGVTKKDYVHKLKGYIKECIIKACQDMEVNLGIFMGTDKIPPLKEMEFRIKNVYSILFGEKPPEPMIQREYKKFYESGDPREIIDHGEVNSIIPTREDEFSFGGIKRLEIIGYGNPIYHDIVVIVPKDYGHDAYFMSVESKNTNTIEKSNRRHFFIVPQHEDTLEPGEEEGFIEKILSLNDRYILRVTRPIPIGMPIKHIIEGAAIRYAMKMEAYKA
ncbi:hypothetical protein KY366_08710 [Candidatus Woesearchaeota archaeon]|nr:hypothetical protein [Candidatus Woesearchaeota archaeon]